jgi:hypothetical protein
LSEIFGPIHHDSGITALAGKTGSPATRQQGHAEFSARGNGVDDIVDRFRYDYTNGNLTVIRRVHGVDAFAAIIESNFPFDTAF